MKSKLHTFQTEREKIIQMLNSRNKNQNNNNSSKVDIVSAVQNLIACVDCSKKNDEHETVKSDSKEGDEASQRIQYLVAEHNKTKAENVKLTIENKKSHKAIDKCIDEIHKLNEQGETIRLEAARCNQLKEALRLDVKQLEATNNRLRNENEALHKKLWDKLAKLDGTDTITLENNELRAENKRVMKENEKLLKRLGKNEIKMAENEEEFSKGIKQLQALLKCDKDVLTNLKHILCNNGQSDTGDLENTGSRAKSPTVEEKRLKSLVIAKSMEVVNLQVCIEELQKQDNGAKRCERCSHITHGQKSPSSERDLPRISLPVISDDMKSGKALCAYKDSHFYKKAYSRKYSSVSNLSCNS